MVSNNIVTKFSTSVRFRLFSRSFDVAIATNEENAQKVVDDEEKGDDDDVVLLSLALSSTAVTR